MNIEQKLTNCEISVEDCLMVQGGNYPPAMPDLLGIERPGCHALLVEEAEKLKQLNHHDAPAIVRQVSAMEARWQRFLSRMEDHRAMLEASIEFHQLYEQVCY